MIRKIVSIVTLASSIAGVSSVQAADICYKLSDVSGGQLRLLDPSVPEDCLRVQHRLEASGKFPDIFSSTVPPSPVPKLHPVCFVSNGDISATIGTTEVTITTYSTLTSEFGPAQFGLGTDNLASVITQWVVKVRGRVVGNIFAHDTIDTSTGSELDEIRAANGRFAGFRGAIRADSHLSFDEYGQLLVNIDSLNGTLCTSD